MKANKTILISSIIAIVLCVALVVGTTIAVFTAETSLDISFSSGSLKLNAQITNFKLYSALKDDNGDLTDTDNNRYSYKEQNANFVNGGSADVNEKEKAIALGGMCPGDKLEFDIKLKNEGTINAKYNALITLDKQESNVLYKALKLSAAEVADADANDGVSVTPTDESSFRSGWIKLDKNGESTLRVSIALPITASNDYQDKSVNLKCIVSAIQNVENAEDKFALIYNEQGEHIKSVDTFVTADFQKTIDEIPDGGRLELLRSNTNPVDGDIVINNKSVTIASADGQLRSLAGVHFVVRGGSSHLTLQGIGLAGDSYIDVSQAQGLTLDGCVITANPSCLYDEATQTSLPIAGFIVSNSVQQSGVQLKVTNCKFAPTSESAAIYVNGAIGGGSTIANNSFGSAEDKLDYVIAPIQINSAVYDIADRRILSVNSNNFVLTDGSAAMSFAQNAEGIYYVSSSHNTLEGSSVLADINAPVAFADYGSTVEGSPVTTAFITLRANALFAGVNARFNSNNQVTSGMFKLAASLDETAFRSQFVAGGANITVG